jgi:AraC-like DNA-binding protein
LHFKPGERKGVGHRLIRRRRKKMPVTQKIRTIGAKVVVEELRRQALDTERIANEAGLEMREINREEGWIPYLKHAALVEIAAHETGDDYFGLHIAEQVDPRDLGALGYIGLSSQTLGDALLNLERYLATITEAFRIEMSVEDDFAYVKFEPAHSSFLRHRQANEFGAGVFVKAYQFFTKSEIAPARVQFVHKFNGDAKEHTKVLGCPVAFGHNRTLVILNRRDMATLIETADHRLLRILTTHCDDILEKRASSKPEHITSLERHIIELLPKGQAKAKVVATELGMSERTLVRNLAEKGTSFSEILSQLRHELALKYLREPELNLTQVAFLLGYANQSAFSAAFKRTTGQAPREMRAAG